MRRSCTPWRVRFAGTEKVRRELSVVADIREVYLDNSATTPVLPEIADKVREVMVRQFGNPSSLHRKGLEAETLVVEARRQVSQGLGVRDEEIIFTSGGTEANNLALFGAAMANRRRGRRIVSSPIEHPSVLEVLKKLGEQGFEIVFCPVDSTGRVYPEKLASLITPDTILVSIMTVNNEIGTVQPVSELVKACKQVNPGLIFHTDCVQALGKIIVAPKQTGADMISLSSHKIHGPKGVGALYVARGVFLESLLYGGGQERGIRSGTENVPGIVGFGLAVQMATADLEAHAGRMRRLKTRLIEQLDSNGVKFRINGPPLDQAAPHIVSLSFPGVRGEVLVHYLEGEDIFVSTGAACSSRKVKISHVLKAIGLSRREAEGSIRVSLSILNTEDDINRLAEALIAALKKLRALF
ncbi:MAG TPA: cysteine desulfurase [Syntrophothermus lipocalidus]|nr:cysteine desulfurase [Syntrophothermus lipocalidus]